MRCFSTAVLLVMFAAGHAGATDYALYFLGGQSNMEGYGYVSELPAELSSDQAGVMIFHGNIGSDNTTVDGRGLWHMLRPGHGTGFSTDGKVNHYSERFGVELTFAKAMRASHSDQPVAIIKYAKGGTSIDTDAAGNFGCWDADYSYGSAINQYDHFLATVRNATAVSDIDGDGENDRLIPSGIVWMQGESDACYSLDIAIRYQQHLHTLMNLIRTAFRSDDMPVVIGRISDSGNDDDGIVWKWGNVVRQAQVDYVKADGNATLVTSTDDYSYSDPWHYDTAGYIDLGKQFASALIILQNQPLFRTTHSTYYRQQKTQFELLENTAKDIMLLGDSITDCGEWSELLPGYLTRNRGISGDRTDGVLKRMDEILSGRPKKIFLMIGVNDLSLGFSVDDIIANYRRIIRDIRNGSPETKLYIQSLLPVNPAPEYSRFRDHVNKTRSIQLLNSRLKDLAKASGLTYIDLYSHFTVEHNYLNPDYTNDGLHLTGPGYIMWVSLLQGYLKE
ncbi:hypothetical protein KAR48_15355 [bacterium]|nr:hypothetical protein [bacterium]